MNERPLFGAVFCCWGVVCVVGCGCSPIEVVDRAGAWHGASCCEGFVGKGYGVRLGSCCDGGVGIFALCVHNRAPFCGVAEVGGPEAYGAFLGFLLHAMVGGWGSGPDDGHAFLDGECVDVGSVAPACGDEASCAIGVVDAAIEASVFDLCGQPGS